MEIIHYLDSIDKQWLLALNNDYPPFWDSVMWIISGKITWIPFYVALLYALIRNWGKQSFWLIGALILAVIIADQISSGIIKEVVQRWRPSRDPEIQNAVALVNNYRGGNYGFVSSHASNSFAVALLSSFFFRNKLYTITAFIWASLVAYSRIYLGVHYPGDILGGIMVGVLTVLLIYYLLKKYRPFLFSPEKQPLIHSNVPAWVISATFLVLIVYSAVVA
jgi:undecaprenyl-diphosphatase